MAKTGVFSRKRALTEHGLQAHEAADEVVEVDGQVGLGVAGDDELVQLFVQFIAFYGKKGKPPLPQNLAGGDGGRV